MRGPSCSTGSILSFPFQSFTTMLMKVEIPASVYQIMLAHALSTEKVFISHTHTITRYTDTKGIGRDYWYADRWMAGKYSTPYSRNGLLMGTGNRGWRTPIPSWRLEPWHVFMLYPCWHDRINERIESRLHQSNCILLLVLQRYSLFLGLICRYKHLHEMLLGTRQKDGSNHVCHWMGTLTTIGVSRQG